MSATEPTENLHLRRKDLPAEQILKLLQLQQSQRDSPDPDADFNLIYSPLTINHKDTTTFTSAIPVNRAPQINHGALSYTMKRGSSRTISISASDDDGNPLTWDKVSGPAWATISSGGTLTLNPNTSQTVKVYTIILRVRDNQSPRLEDRITLTVDLLTHNTAPVLVTVGNRTIQAGRRLRINLQASDAQGDDITYTKNKSQGELDASTGVFVWTPTDDDVGNLTIRFTASDGSLTHSRDSVITVTAAPPPPTIDPPTLNDIGNKSIKTGQTLNITPTATDGTTPLSFSIHDRRNPSGSSSTFGTFSNGTFTWTPSTSQTGSWRITLRVTDDDGRTDSETITITVTPANTAPRLSPIGNKTIQKTRTLTIRPSADDDEDDTLYWSKTGVGSINASTGVYTYSPGSGTSIGNKSATITVRDRQSGGLSDSETIQIAVTAAPTRPKPTVGSISNRTIDVGEVTSVLLTATGGTGTKTFTHTGVGSISNTDNGPQWSYTGAATGTHEVVIKATDAGGQTDTEEFSVTVRTPPPPAPTLVIYDAVIRLSHPNGEPENTVDAYASIYPVGREPDGTPIQRYDGSAFRYTFSVAGLPTGWTARSYARVSGGALRINFDHPYISSQNYYALVWTTKATYTCTVTGSNGITTSQTADIIIRSPYVAQ